MSFMQRTTICFQAESKLSARDDHELVHLYYVIRIVNPSSGDSGGGERGCFRGEVKPVFVSHCLVDHWFALRSGIYALGSCSSEQHSHSGETSVHADGLFRFFDFTQPPDERFWKILPSPPRRRIRSTCVAASVDNKLYIFGWGKTRFHFIRYNEDEEDSDGTEDILFIPNYNDRVPEDDEKVPWIEMFDPRVGSWSSPFAGAPPAFPESLDTTSYMYAAAWPPSRILFTAPTKHYIYVKFGFDVNENHSEPIYTERENLPFPKLFPPGDDALFIDGIFYYLAAFTGHLFAYEVATDCYFSVPLEDNLAAKARINELDVLHIGDDRFCFIFQDRYNTKHNILECRIFKISKVEKNDIQTQEAGLRGTLKISQLSSDMYLVDKFMKRSKAVWLEGDWNEVQGVNFNKFPAREIAPGYVPQRSLRSNLLHTKSKGA